MTDRAPADRPLEIHRIESSRAGSDGVRLRLTGRWLDPAAAEEEELLVVQVQGRRHRFAASRDDQPGAPEDWSASFMLPTWAEPLHPGQAALWLGNAVIPVPPPGRGGRVSPAVAPPVAPAVAPPVAPAVAPPVAPPPSVVAPAPSAPEPTPSAVSPPSPDDTAPEGPRAGPLADLLLKETVTALHAELEQRSADAARMRGALADAQSELQARIATQSALEATHAELRGEFERLTAAVGRHRDELAARTADVEAQRADLQRQVSELSVAYDERAAEVAALREEHAREVDALREEHAREVDALRERHAREVDAQREQHAGEIARLRQEHAGETAALHRELARAKAHEEQRDAEAVGLRADLAAASVARDALVSETASLRDELGRLGTELAATRERVDAETGDLGEAHRLLAEARAFADELRAGGGARSE